MNRNKFKVYIIMYHILLFFIILIEGFVTLATELLAIRQIIPFVGSGTETIAVLISSVLLPLAVGYYYGGKVDRSIYKHKTFRSILSQNMLIAAFIITLGLSYHIMTIFFNILYKFNINDRIIQTAIYGLLFLVYPTFLLGQTVPLVSNYFKKKKIPQLTGKMLFFSTLGSFLGSIFTTVFLMNIIGVNNTIIFNVSLLVMLVIIMHKNLINLKKLLAAMIFCLAIILNSNLIFNHNIIASNSYNTVSIKELPKENSRVLMLNNSISAKYTINPEHRFLYIKYIEDLFLKTLAGQHKSILVLGAGGFTIGLNDTTNNYTFVDIDGSLKEISEKYLLKQELSANKHFVAEPGEYFIHHNDKKFDLIILDVYSHKISIPPSFVTVEFFNKVKQSLAQDGILVANIITKANFNDKFSNIFNNSFKAVFPNFSRYPLGYFNPWQQNNYFSNIIYTFYNNQHNNLNSIYTNNLNTGYKDSSY